jgi:hypothetical protein
MVFWNLQLTKRYRDRKLRTMRVIEMIQRVKQRSNREGGKRVPTKFSKLGFGSKELKKFANIVILVFI